MLKEKTILFLDIDGVLTTDAQYNSNPKKWNPAFNVYGFDYKCVKIFNEIFDNFDVDIVLSSDWKTHFDLNEINNIFKFNKVHKEVKAFTKNLWGSKYFRIDQLEECRANEILDYVKKHDIKKFLVIDDLNLSKWIDDEHFVRTPKSNEGIKQSGIKDKIIKRLKNEI